MKKPTNQRAVRKPERAASLRRNRPQPPPAESVEEVRARAKRLRYFRAYRDRLAEQMLTAVLRNLAAYDAAVVVNETLQGRLNLPNAAIDEGDVVKIMERITRLEIESLLVGASTLSARAKREFVDRLVAQVAPNRDGPPVQTQTGLGDVGALRRALAKSIEQQFPANPRGDPNPQASRRTWPPNPVLPKVLTAQSTTRSKPRVGK